MQILLLPMTTRSLTFTLLHLSCSLFYDMITFVNAHFFALRSLIVGAHKNIFSRSIYPLNGVSVYFFLLVCLNVVICWQKPNDIDTIIGQHMQYKTLMYIYAPPRSIRLHPRLLTFVHTSDIYRIRFDIRHRRPPSGHSTSTKNQLVNIARDG